MKSKKVMTANKYSVKAFTLIELLVVVLIIGILAAIAVPQYQKAVKKSRAMQALSFIKSAGESWERYVLQHGPLSPSDKVDWAAFDIELPGYSGTEDWYYLNSEWRVDWNWAGIWVANRKTTTLRIGYSAYIGGRYFCTSSTAEDKKFCESLGAKDIPPASRTCGFGSEITNCIFFFEG